MAQKGKAKTAATDGVGSADLLTLEGAMHFLAISKPTIYRLLRDGKLQGTKVGGQWRFRREDLRAHSERRPSGVPLAAAQEAIREMAFFEEQLGREIPMPPDSESSESGQIARLVNAIFSIALEAGASDIHFEPKSTGVLVRQRIDGVLHEIRTLPSSLVVPVVNRLKTMGDIDINEKRVPQEGRVHLKYQERSIDARVASCPSGFGEAVTLRLFDQSSVQIDFDRLGFGAEEEATMKGWLHAPNGLTLVTGPTGSGKTTVLYSCVAEIADATKKTVTIEDPVEYVLAHTTQTHVTAKAGLTFSAAVRAFLRQDPDIIVIGELRDLETCQGALQAALTGHLVLSILHANSAADAIARLLDLGVEPFLLSAALRGVTSQRLVRRVCSDCREAYQPDAALLGRVAPLAAAGGYKLPKKIQWTRGRGCAKCRQSGFRGRIGIYEVLNMNDELRQAVLRRAAPQELYELALKHGMISLAASGIQKAVEGITTPEEVLRVLGFH